MTIDPRAVGRPILFSAPMVRAILDDRKTQTRRIVKRTVEGSPYRDDWVRLPGPRSIRTPPCPYGAVGDLLWVRETWYCDHFEVQRGPYREVPQARELLYYRATDAVRRDGRECWTGFSGETMTPPWKPGIHMPRWASRITLRITGTRVERLQDVSAMDAIAEGICRVGERWEAEGICATPIGPTDAYRALWNYINGIGSWDLNPWVWVVSFEKLQQERAAA